MIVLVAIALTLAVLALGLALASLIGDDPLADWDRRQS